MKFSHLAPIMAALIVPAAASAQAPAAAPSASQAAANLTVGAKVYDLQGGDIGTIESVAGGNVVVNTGTNRATLAATAFGTGTNGPTLNTTRAALDALVAQAAAKSASATKAALVPGAEVRGKEGTVVGKIQQVAGDQVVIDRPSGAVSLTSQFFTTDASGVILTVSVAELDAAQKSATAANSNAPAGSASK